MEGMSELKTKVWLSLIVIYCLLFSACAQTEETIVTVPPELVNQDTLGMEPDFSYAVILQTPHIMIDQLGYRDHDKKSVFVKGIGIEENFQIRDDKTQEVIYTGNLHKVKELDTETLYMGDFSKLEKEGTYYIYHDQLGDSYPFVIENSTYDQKFLNLQKEIKEYSYYEKADVGSLAYVLANMMFIQEMFPEAGVDSAFIEQQIKILLQSNDVETGAFFSELLLSSAAGNTDLKDGSQTAPIGVIIPDERNRTISLSTTAEMAGVLAQYAALYKDKDSVFANQCLSCSQKAYTYVEAYRDNTDTDAWYYAAVQLLRATGGYKYRNAINEYDAYTNELKTSTKQGYTILADFTYLATKYGADYNRCNRLLNEYMNRAQNISVESLRENFYVPANIGTMDDGEILNDMIVLGVINHILSGQEYQGIQKNYLHYLAGTNLEVKDYLSENIIIDEQTQELDLTNAAKLLVIYSNLIT